MENCRLIVCSAWILRIPCSGLGCGDPGRNVCQPTTDIAQRIAQLQLAWHLAVFSRSQSQSLRFSMRKALFFAMAKGEVACDLVEDYLPNGTSLGWVQPSVKCAASHDQCPCRGAQ